jgi:hypothetical protein
MTATPERKFLDYVAEQQKLLEQAKGPAKRKKIYALIGNALLEYLDG